MRFRCRLPVPAGRSRAIPHAFGLSLLLLTSGIAARADALPEGRADRDVVRQAIESVGGPLPRSDLRPDSGLRVESEERLPGYRRLRISYRSEPDGRVPAWLLIPGDEAIDTGPRRLRAALALHQTHPAGSRVVVGLGDSPDDEYGVEMARRGWVILAPPYPLLADYHPDLARLGHRSGTLKAVWDNLRGLDLLASLPAVRTNGFAAIGHSLGGHNALFTAAFDPRIVAIATSCAFDAFRDYYDGDPAVWQPERGWCQTRYLPGLAAYRGRLDQIPFDFADLLAVQSLHGGVWINAPLGDSNFRWRSVARVVRAAWPAFATAGRTEALQVRYPDSAHRFPPELREEAYRFLERALEASNALPTP